MACSVFCVTCCSVFCVPCLPASYSECVGVPNSSEQIRRKPKNNENSEKSRNTGSLRTFRISNHFGRQAVRQSAQAQGWQRVRHCAWGRRLPRPRCATTLFAAGRAAQACHGRSPRRAPSPVHSSRAPPCQNAHPRRRRRSQLPAGPGRRAQAQPLPAQPLARTPGDNHRAKLLARLAGCPSARQAGGEKGGAPLAPPSHPRPWAVGGAGVAKSTGDDSFKHTGFKTNWAS